MAYDIRVTEGSLFDVLLKYGEVYANWENNPESTDDDHPKIPAALHKLSLDLVESAAVRNMLHSRKLSF